MPAVFQAKVLNYLIIAWGWGLAVTMGVYVAGAVSDAHINPAVTLAFALRRQFPWWKVLPYWFAQVAGAYAGAAIAYFNYSGLLHAYETKFHIVRGVTGINDLSSAAVTEAKIFYIFPRLLAFTVGFGSLALPGPNGYMWVPMVGPLIGGVAGALIYDLGIHSVLVARKEAASGAEEPRGETVREKPGADDHTIEPRGRTAREV